MKQYGFVVSQVDDSVVIEVARSSACGDKCGTCASNCKKSVINTQVKNRLDAKVGDYIEIEVADKSILRAAVIVYIMPLILLMVGIGLGYSIGESLDTIDAESAGAIMGFLFMGLSALALKQIDRFLKKKNKHQFYMSKVL